MKRARPVRGPRDGGAVRAATLVLLAAAALVRAQTPEVEFRFVPGTDVQAGGPVHDFRISIFEIRNDQFIGFLNEALLHPDDHRGRYLYVDASTGDVYVNTSETGEVGLGPDGRTVLIFAPAAAGQIDYVDGAYALVTDPDDAAHPVTGVTWFGAVKYCNWLTLAQGLGPGARAYAEGPATDLNLWRPVTITAADWSTRDLNDAERAALLALPGYRLPMDAGTDSAEPYGEWLKASAARFDGNLGVVVFDALYGFGRDSIGPADANFDDSDDPFEPGTTPVGFFNGVNTLSTGSLTADTANAYGLYDLSGNVWEWMQDQVPTDPARRANRGGSWLNPGGSLLRIDRSAHRLAMTQDGTTGFRVVQSVTAPLMVTPAEGFDASGVWGGPYDEPPGGSTAYTLTNLTDASVAFAITPDAPWIVAEPTSGTIAPGEAVSVVLAIDNDCGTDVAVGANDAIVTMTAAGESIARRAVSFTVAAPVSITPAEGLDSTMPVGGRPVPAGTSFVLNNASDTPVPWSATWTDTSSVPSGLAWIKLNDAARASGIVPAQSSRAVSADIVEAIGAMLPPGDYSARIDFVDDCTGAVASRDVRLTVASPFSVTPDETVPLEASGVFGGPFQPDTFDWSVTRQVGQSISWAVFLCQEPAGSSTCTPPGRPWLALEPTSGTLVDGAPIVVSGTIESTAASLLPGDYAVTVRFADDASGYHEDRTVNLHVTGLEVSPAEDVYVTGPVGGPFSPELSSFTLANSTGTQMSWEASVSFTPPPADIDNVAWLSVTPTAGAILDPGGQELVEARIAVDAILLPPGLYEAAITFTPNETTEASTTRTVTLEIAGEAFSVAMKLVPGDDTQVAGPTHTFRIGTFEVTNREFARFLNDARRNPDNARGRHLYFDTLTGNVWISTAADEGPLPPIGPDTAPIYDASLGRIEYDAAQAQPYVIEPGYEDNPVVGVSWYGAAKFCNWLSAIQKVPAGQRAYTEGPTVSEWRPVDFDPGDPAANLTGYRLPMDGMRDEADLFNEWYKAAAHTGVDTDGVARFDAVYGFGRSVLSSADANYLFSGDLLDEGTTAVGYFNGVTLLADGTFTRDTGNGYRLYDLCGNVAEWVHALDLSGGSPVGATRGGHYLDSELATSLRNDSRVARPPDGAFAFAGFRVAQSLVPTSVVVSDAVVPVRARGPVGGAFTSTSFTLELVNDSDYTVDDITYSLSSNGGWLGFEGTPPSHLPARSSTTLSLELTEAADGLGVSPKPAEAMALIPASEVQPDGPAYDYWIGETEVTNNEFAQFLNDTRADAELETPTAKSAFLYFDDVGGGIFINDEQTPASGVGPPPTGSPVVLYDTSVGRVALIDGTYEVRDGFDLHPVVGVSWFGAVKYCNWLTLQRGLEQAMRAYAEGPTPDDWHPVTVTTEDWIARGITAGERSALVDKTIGYRLPMDGGGGPSATNEWNKAASARVDEAGAVVFDAAYGFGRSALGDADANFYDSGDTEEDGTTPVGQFDGVTMLADDDRTTKATDNRYGLLDVTGNVAEWIQDTENAGDVSARALRGGSWRDAADAPRLRSDGRTALPPDATRDDVGFRIVRGTGFVASIVIEDRIATETVRRHAILDVVEPLAVSPLSQLERAGPFCTDLLADAEPVTYTIRNDSAAALPIDFATDADWLTLTSPQLPSLTGELDAGATAELTVTANETVNNLLPGVHEAEITMTRENIPRRILSRRARVTVEPSARVTFVVGAPAYSGIWEGPFDGPADVAIQIARCADCGSCDLDYTIDVTAPWLTVDPDIDLNGTLPPVGTTLDLSVALNEQAETLPPGEYEAAIRATLIDAARGPLPQPPEVSVDLTVLDPIVIDGEGVDWPVPCVLDSAGMSRTYMLANRHGSKEIGVAVAADVPWLEVAPALVSIAPGAEAIVTVSLDETALMSADEVGGRLTFDDLLTGFRQERDVTVRIDQALCVTPLLDVEAWGRVGGPVQPARAEYELANIGDAPIDWRVDTDAAWLLVNGARRDGAPLTGTLDVGETAALIASVDVGALPPVPAGEREVAPAAALTVTDRSGTNTPLTREYRVHLVESLTDVKEVLVAAAADQPGGPRYSFLAGRFHVTNAEYVLFLNDALSRPDAPRGAYLFFDHATGDVYLNDAERGASGPSPGTRSVRIFQPAQSGQIEFAGGAYRVASGAEDYADHPVTGVSWLGAVKYANWLTLDRGLPPSHRCYTESTDPAEWHPKTISTEDWATRDLTDAERQPLVGDYRGYRLPMDDGYNNLDRTIDEADEFNEWYKAAAWSLPPGAVTPTNTLYGFGRNVLTRADANYRCSQDPFEDAADCAAGGSTPAGYYDGTTKSGGFATVANDNGFGLFDMTGNVNQWVQGWYTPSALPDRRTLRGGSWDDVAGSDSLELNRRTLFAPQTTTDRRIGFRVVRTIPPSDADLDADGDVDLHDFNALAVCQLGPGAVPPGECGRADLDADADTDLEDVAMLLREFNEGP